MLDVRKLYDASTGKLNVVEKVNSMRYLFNGANCANC